jgi:hypothetical protein
MLIDLICAPHLISAVGLAAAQAIIALAGQAWW